MRVMRMERKRLNREQEEVFSLLKEIDMVCRKHRITYYLSPRLTWCAVFGKEFPENPLAGAVLVKMADMEKLRKVLEAEHGEGRAVESMKDNKRFPGLFLRYVNKNTLCFRLYEGRNYRYPGLGIDIIPLRSKNVSGRVRSWDNRLETGWVQICDSARYRIDFYKFSCGCLVRTLCLLGRRRLGEKIYDRLIRNQNTTDTGKYTLKWSRNFTYEYPAEVFQEAKEAELHGTRFLIPCDEVGYLKGTFGPNYAKHIFYDNYSRMSVMASARVGCEKFLEEAGPLRKQVKRRRRLFAADQFIYHHCKEYADWCWDYAKECAERWELRMAYDGKKEYIRNLWESRDLAALDKVFRPCGRMMRRCFKTEEIFELDEEIMEIYLDYLRESGREKLLLKIGKYRNCAAN